ncbi:hypothetical protein LQ954_00480 [Sphingomonas sp. IC-11]|uniref:hypothetical protein n=1 Tax=Sphingomonas sp. IC-11 TaxID=2898528 RepID=UPI001E2C6EC1|nr:hypothetical protein [Sphingomonas sp. IC-11]MCD2314618.1 hypothetical protein [Sphingomonas sp. IC-11]
MPKLKVYRTPAGFHDAYVAAPSQKAALAAWGSDANLFARGMAEVVTDPDLTREPLAHPGEVIRVARTMADAPDPPAPKPAPRGARPDAAARKPPPKPKAKPSRAALDKAEAAIEAAEARYAEERAQLKLEEEALAARRRALDKAQAAERTKLDRARIQARDAYDAALDDWRRD